jgi:hypothetical protein
MYVPKTCSVIPFCRKALAQPRRKYCLCAYRIVYITFMQIHTNYTDMTLPNFGVPFVRHLTCVGIDMYVHTLACTHALTWLCRFG